MNSGFKQKIEEGEVGDIDISPSQFIMERREDIHKIYIFKDKIGEGIFLNADSKYRCFWQSL